MKQVGTKNVHFHRQVAKETAVVRTKQAGGAHAFSYPAKAVSGTEPRKFVVATDVGPGIITKGLKD